jgi:hypothetical protein
LYISTLLQRTGVSQSLRPPTLCTSPCALRCLFKHLKLLNSITLTNGISLHICSLFALSFKHAETLFLSNGLTVTDMRIHGCFLLKCGPSDLQQLTAVHHSLFLVGSSSSGQSLSVKTVPPITADSAMIGANCRLCYDLLHAAHSARRRG